MESLITKYDDIFLNQSRICSLIDKFNQESQFDELDVLGKLVGGYIYHRGPYSPDSSPMSMRIILGETFDTKIIEDVFAELSLKDGFIIQTENRCTYISLY